MAAHPSMKEDISLRITAEPKILPTTGTAINTTTSFADDWAGPAKFSSVISVIAISAEAVDPDARWAARVAHRKAGAFSVGVQANVANRTKVRFGSIPAISSP